MSDTKKEWSSLYVKVVVVEKVGDTIRVAIKKMNPLGVAKITMEFTLTATQKAQVGDEINVICILDVRGDINDLLKYGEVRRTENGSIGSL